uniref:Transcription factor MYBS1 n=1 Tax=Ananas comosus var. bracteatus TaxID=296719 RepID=A0A6V7QMF9_ANACO|nr:unnamed protein product [Ananas comosus var. bracteatus]
MDAEESSSSFCWSWDEEKAFENAVAAEAAAAAAAEVEERGGEWRWEEIAAAVPGKTPGEVERHYRLLVEDVERIELGRVPLPEYVGESEDSGEDDGGGNGKRGGRGSKGDVERRKGVAWTEDEHRRFLLGLEEHGKGDWRSISRNFVKTRTPTQVASHAQKYFIRLKSMNKERRRTSIHDITTTGNADGSGPQGPITGETNGPTTPNNKPAKQPSQDPACPPGVGLYGSTLGQPTLGQPFAAPFISFACPPVDQQMTFRMGPPISGSVVTSVPLNIATRTYHMPHTSAH